MNDLEHLTLRTREFGQNSRLVQGGGGNVSLKSKDTLFVKASGFRFAEMDAARTYATLPLTPIVDFMLRAKDAHDLESGADTILNAHHRGPKASIETTLHAVLGPVVVHTHPNSVLRVLCRRDVELTLFDTLRDALSVPVVLVPYAAPGATLTFCMLQAFAVQGIDRLQSPVIVLLQNHGLITVGRTVDEAFDLTLAVERSFPSPRTQSLSKKIVNDDALAYFLAQKSPLFTPPQSASTEVPVAWCEGRLPQGTVFPDQAVYLGPAPLFLVGRDPDLWNAEYEAFMAHWSLPPKIVIHQTGAIYFNAKSAATLLAQEEIWQTLIEALLGQEAQVAFLSDADVRFLIHWEKEKYRQAVLIP